jgi:acylphosphatase
MEEIVKHYLISGRVQGVGFRAFTARLAVKLDLKGWVRNLRDGRVEAFAKGSAARLLEFESSLRAGPPQGRVETLAVREWPGPSAFEFTDFAVQPDGAEPCAAD